MSSKLNTVFSELAFPPPPKICSPLTLKNFSDFWRHLPFSVHLRHDILIVVISQRPWQLVVIHVRLRLPLAPPARHLIRIRQLEFPAIPVLPDDTARIRRALIQQLQQKLPQLYLPTADVRAGRTRIVPAAAAGTVVLTRRSTGRRWSGRPATAWLQQWRAGRRGWGWSLCHCCCYSPWLWY